MSNYIKLIHTLKGKAGMSEGDYRALLQRCGGGEDDLAAVVSAAAVSPGM